MTPAPQHAGRPATARTPQRRAPPRRPRPAALLPLADAAASYGLGYLPTRRWCLDHGHTLEPRTADAWRQVFASHPRVVYPGRRPLPRAPDGRLWVEVARDCGVSDSAFYTAISAGRSPSHAAFGEAIRPDDLLRRFAALTVATFKGSSAVDESARVRRLAVAVGDLLRLRLPYPAWVFRRLAAVSVDVYADLVEHEARTLRESGASAGARVRHRDEVSSLLRTLQELRFVRPELAERLHLLHASAIAADQRLVRVITRDRATEHLGERAYTTSARAWLFNFPVSRRRVR